VSKKIKIQIKSIWGSVLFEWASEDNTLKDTVIEAVKRSADLSGAYLSGAYLRSADLRSADLSGADLRSADLSGAYLRSADLSGAKFDEPIYFSELYNLKLLPPKTKLTMWKWLKDSQTPYQYATYRVGKTYSVENFNTDEFQECGEGLNVATLTWCLRESKGKNNVDLIEVEFLVSDIVALPYWTDGKFRVKQFKVLRKISRDDGMKIMKDISGIKE
jgi:uncharacterized protein YjbI with pentapeptide repeats